MTPEVAIKGFGGAILLSARPDKTAELLGKVMGLEQIGIEEDLARYRSSAEIGNVIYMKLTTVGREHIGVGTVHHIAWRASDDENQLEWKKVVESYGYRVTPVQDRNYFNAIYRAWGNIV